MLCALAGANQAHGAIAPFTLEAALDEAQQGSIALKSWQAAAMGAQWRVHAAATAFVPRLSLEAGHVFTSKFAAEATGLGPTGGVVVVAL